MGLGDIVLTIESLGGATPPSPSVADALYLGFFPLAYVALVLMVRGETRRLSTPNWLDGAVAGFGCGAVCAAFAFSAIVHATDARAASAWRSTSPIPVGDVLLLLLVAGGTAVMSGRRKAPWLLVAAGITVNVLGDTANLLSSSAALAVGVIINAAAWPTSILLLSVAMWLPPGLADPLADQQAAGLRAARARRRASDSAVLFLAAFGHVNPVAIGRWPTATLLLVGARTWRSRCGRLRARTQDEHRRSVTDHLTGLGNRRHLFDVLDAFFAQGPEAQGALAFLFIDLNGFKQINDSFGHPVGDEILEPRRRATGRARCAPDDLLARRRRRRVRGPAARTRTGTRPPRSPTGSPPASSSRS